MILYSNNCPVCRTVKKILNEKNIEYTEIDDINEIMNTARENNISSLPFADIDGVVYTAQKLVSYLKEKGGNN